MNTLNEYWIHQSRPWIHQITYNICHKAPVQRLLEIISGGELNIAPPARGTPRFFATVWVWWFPPISLFIPQSYSTDTVALVVGRVMLCNLIGPVAWRMLWDVIGPLAHWMPRNLADRLEPQVNNPGEYQDCGSDWKANKHSVVESNWI